MDSCKQGYESPGSVTRGGYSCLAERVSTLPEGLLFHGVRQAPRHFHGAKYSYSWASRPQTIVLVIGTFCFTGTFS